MHWIFPTVSTNAMALRRKAPCSSISKLERKVFLKLILFLALLASSASSDIALCTGIAPLLNSSRNNLAFNMNFSFTSPIKKAFGVGYGFGLNRWSLVESSGQRLEYSYSIYEFLALTRFSKTTNNVKLFIQPGLGVGIPRVSFEDPAHNFQPEREAAAFEISAETGLDVKKFEFKVGYKNLFTDIEHTHWLIICIGIAF